MDIINIFSFCFCFNENNYVEGNAIIINIDDNHDEYGHNDDYFHEIVIGIDFEYLYYEEFFNYILLFSEKYFFEIFKLFAKNNLKI